MDKKRTPNIVGESIDEALGLIGGKLIGEAPHNQHRESCLNHSRPPWRGYLDETSGVRLRDWLAGRRIPLNILDSSGHASPVDLQRFAAAIDAREVVPVHTRQATGYSELFANVRERADGEWWAVQA